MKKLFNDGWSFALKNIGDLPEEKDFHPVDIPHDRLIYDVSGLYRSGDGWYKKTFGVEKPEEKIYSLRFEGVYMDSEVYLNGKKIFEWKYGYTTFDVPLKGLKDGENEIKVRARYQDPNTRWYAGSGIYRNVWLRETGKTRIADDGTYVVSYIEGDSWSTEIDTEIEGQEACTVKHTLFDADGEVAAVCHTAVPAETDRVSQKFEISSPELWSPDRPYLYSLLTEIIIGDESVDQSYERIGYKYARYDRDRGFFLNGKSLKLNGVCLHHDLGALGSAVNRAATRRQLLTMKQMGVNAIRTSHNPPSVEFMELCDELGLMVDSEAFDMWELKKTDYDYSRFFKEWHERDVRSWIRRDRNHVSVIMWSIGNEIYDTHASPHGVEITKELSRCVRIDDYKNAHPITIGSNYMRWEGAQNCAENIDLVGYNYTESIYDEHHAAHPNWVIYGSETGSTIQSRGIYHFPAEVFAATHDDGQCSSLMNCSTGWSAPTAEYNIIEDRNRRFSLGQFVWTGTDYIGEPTPYRTKNSYFGHVDTAGFPKDTFYAYRAEWNKQAPPFIHLFPYWDFNEGQIIDIFAYTNCDEAEVFVNGRSLGKHTHDHKSGEDLSGRWKAEYHKGEIKAVGYINGAAVCEDVRKSFSDPEKIVLKPDRTTMFANGEDMIFIEVSTVDALGNAVENARSRINVKVSGPARLMGLDNGDSTDREQYKTSSRRLFSGKLLIMLAASDRPGDITVEVTSPGLEGCTAALKALPARIAEGISCKFGVENAEPKNDVSVRKIELGVSSQIITPESGNVGVTLSLLPKNTTFTLDDVGLKAVSESGVETNLSSVEKTSGGAIIKPRGDGKYRLRAYCKNGTEFEEVISEIEMENRGFGPAGFEPYGEIVLASICSNAKELLSTMEGGVLVRAGQSVKFGKTDFGKIGSDGITFGIYTYNEGEIPVELYVDGEPFKTLIFQAKNEWNTYKYNTVALPKKLCGVHDLEFKFSEELRFKGFKFSEPRRKGVEMLAVENDGIYGDSFVIGSEMIERIGNNVSVLFKSVDLGDGATGVEITGMTRNENDTLHLRFSNSEARSVEFEKNGEVVTKRFEIEPVAGKADLSLVFLPGCDFDLKSIKLI